VPRWTVCRLNLGARPDNHQRLLAFPSVPNEEDGMSLVRPLGFTTLRCGCVVGRYREVATSREVRYVEEKGKGCVSHHHRRNQTIVPDRVAAIARFALDTKAS